MCGQLKTIKYTVELDIKAMVELLSNAGHTLTEMQFSWNWPNFN